MLCVTDAVGTRALLVLGCAGDSHQRNLAWRDKRVKVSVGVGLRGSDRQGIIAGVGSASHAPFFGVGESLAGVAGVEGRVNTCMSVSMSVNVKISLRNMSKSEGETVNKRPEPLLPKSQHVSLCL